MRLRAAIFWTLLALPALPAVRSGTEPTAPGYARMVSDFRQKNVLDLQQHFPFTVVLAFTPTERDNIAVLAAQTLTVPDGSDALPDYAAWKAFVASRWHNHTSSAYTMKFYAVALLSGLSQRHGVTTPQVIPALLHALGHPDRYFIGQNAFYALAFLTGHRSGERYWSRLVEDDPARRRALSWWNAWWQEAKTKHPVLDSATEAQARKDTLAVARRIETQIKPEFPELKAFAVSPDNAIASGPLVSLDYDTFAMQGFDGPGPPPRDCRLRVWSHLATPDLTDEGPRPVPAAVNFAGKMQSVFRSVLPGTDIAVEVQVATHDGALIQKIRQTLAPLQTGGAS